MSHFQKAIHMTNFTVALKL